MDNIKELTSLPMPELLTRAPSRKDWKRISAESSLIYPPPHTHTHTHSSTTKSLKGLNCTKLPRQDPCTVQYFLTVNLTENRHRGKPVRSATAKANQRLHQREGMAKYCLGIFFHKSLVLPVFEHQWCGSFISNRIIQIRRELAQYSAVLLSRWGNRFGSSKE